MLQFKNLILGTVLSVSLVPFGALATTVIPSPSPNALSTACTISAAGTANTANSSTSRFQTFGNTVSAKFVVSGTNCKADVTIATWEAPNGQEGKPYVEQKLFNSTTMTGLAAGSYAISAKMPECFFQVDLIRSSKPTDSTGGPVYPAGSLAGSLHGGTTVCVHGAGGGTPSPTPTPSVSPTPLPSPVASPSPTPTTTPAVLSAATTLPDTGSGFATAAEISLMGILLAYYIRQRTASSR